MIEESRISYSLKNISFGLLTQVVQMILGFVSRTIFIRYLAIEYLGVNGLFTSILSMLSLTELGITSAILYALYKPLAEKDEIQIAGLVQFFKKIYFIIAAVIAVLGLLVLPFLSELVKNPPAQIETNLSVIYLIFLFNTVSSYFFQYKLSLFQADQKSYLISKRNLIIFSAQNLAQIISLILFQNFILYLIIQSLFQLAGNLYLSLLVKKHYPFIEKYKREVIEPGFKKQIFSHLKSTAIVKIGGLLVNDSTNIILNYFTGLSMVGILSNYNLLVGLASSLIVQVFSGLTGSIANMNVQESLEKKQDMFAIVNFANFWTYGLASVGIIALLNDFINLWIGKDYLLPFNVVVVLAVNFYLVGMQNAVWTYKSTFGFFKEGRFLVLLTAILNLTFAFILGKYFGLFGILLAMTIARLVTNVWYDPYIVLSKGLNQNPMIYFLKYFKYIGILIISLVLILGISSLVSLDGIWNLVFKILATLLITNSIIFLIFRKTMEIKYLRLVALNILIKIRN